MEKKKLLLVTVSVGVFLVVAIGVSIVLLSPQKGPFLNIAGTSRPVPAGNSSLQAVPPGQYSISGQPELHTGMPSEPATVDASGMLSRPDGVPGLLPPPATVKVQDSVVYIYGENPNAQISDSTISRERRIIEVPSPSAIAVPDADASAGRPSAAAPMPSSTVSAAKPSSAAIPATPKPAPAAVAATPKPAAVKPAPQNTETKVYNDYWVQTGAFSTKDRADNVRGQLASKGIKSIVDIRDVDNKTFYRVRVGPYTSEKEAGYWLSLVKSIEGFENSQIRMSQTRR